MHGKSVGAASQLLGGPLDPFSQQTAEALSLADLFNQRKKRFLIAPGEFQTAGIGR